MVKRIRDDDYLPNMLRSLVTIGYYMNIIGEDNETIDEYALRVCIEVFGPDRINANILRKELAKKNETATNS